MRWSAQVAPRDPEGELRQRRDSAPASASFTGSFDTGRDPLAGEVREVRPFAACRPQTLPDCMSSGRRSSVGSIGQGAPTAPCQGRGSVRNSE